MEDDNTAKTQPVTKRIGEFLLEKGLISQEQLEEALKIKMNEGGMLGQILVRLKYVSEADVVKVLATQFGFPYLPLSNYEIEDKTLGIIPETACRQYYLVPVDRIGNVLTIVMADPLNFYAVRDIEDFTKCSVQIFVSTPSEIMEVIDRHYGVKEFPGKKLSAEDNLSQISFSTAAKKPGGGVIERPEKD